MMKVVVGQHIPVLASEVLSGLALLPNETVIDGTLGAGGHARLMLEAVSPSGRLYGFDRDERNLLIAQKNLAEFGERVEFIHDSFGSLLTRNLVADAILLDLGFSSMHVDDPERGFSFQNDGPLDMRYDTQGELTATTIVNSWSREELAEVFRLYGEEPRFMAIAKAITVARKHKKFETTTQLAELIEGVVPRRGKLHPATFVFQALRIVVNDELGELERGLKGALKSLRPGGRLAVITFHSLEDRVVKQFLKNNAEWRVLGKKPVTPGMDEVKVNRRARSAKLRLAIKL